MIKDELARVSDGPPAVDALLARIEALLNLARIARSLKDLGVKPSSVKTLAAEAAHQWTAGFNPRPVRARDFEAFYRAAFEPRGEGESIPRLDRKVSGTARIRRRTR